MKTSLVRIAAGSIVSAVLAVPTVASAEGPSRPQSAPSGAASSAARAYDGKLGSLHIYAGTKFSTGTATTAEGKQSSTTGRSWGLRWIRWGAQPNADGTVREKNLTFTRAKTVTRGEGSRTFWLRGAAPDKFSFKAARSPYQTNVTTTVTPAGNVVSTETHHGTQTRSTTGTQVTRNTKTGLEVRTTRTAEGTITGLSR